MCMNRSSWCVPGCGAALAAGGDFSRLQGLGAALAMVTPSHLPALAVVFFPQADSEFETLSLQNWGAAPAFPKNSCLHLGEVEKTQNCLFREKLLPLRLLQGPQIWINSSPVSNFLNFALVGSFKFNFKVLIFSCA